MKNHSGGENPLQDVWLALFPEILVFQKYLERRF